MAIPDIDDYMRNAEKQKIESGKVSAWTPRWWGLAGLLAFLTGSEGGCFAGVICVIMALIYWAWRAGENLTDRPGTLWVPQPDTGACGGTSMPLLEPHEWSSDPFPVISEPDPFQSLDEITNPIYSYLPQNIFHESITGCSSLIHDDICCHTDTFNNDIFSSSATDMFSDPFGTDMFSDNFSSPSSDPFNSGFP